MIFDLDDTLYEEMCYVREGFQNTARYLAEKYKLSKKSLEEQMEQVLEENGRGKVFDLVCEKFKIKEEIKTLVECYRNTRPKLELYEDAKRLLEELARGYPEIHTGIITDGNSIVQHNKLEALELEQKIEKIIVTDDLGAEYCKPHPMAYEKMLESFQVKPAEAVYIGDNPKKDFIGAKKLGIHTIRIRRERGSFTGLEAEKGYEAEMEIKNLLEVLRLLEAS